jgi:hypothetical protein
MMVSGGSNLMLLSPTKSVSYKSQHLQLTFKTSVRSPRLIVWGQEVVEGTETKILKSPIFDIIQK